MTLQNHGGGSTSNSKSKAKFEKGLSNFSVSDHNTLLMDSVHQTN